MLQLKSIGAAGVFVRHPKVCSIGILLGPMGPHHIMISRLARLMNMFGLAMGGELCRFIEYVYFNLRMGDLEGAPRAGFLLLKKRTLVWNTFY